MADFDSFDYDIEKRLPEWWKGFGALEPVNQYTQILIADILQGLLTTMGVVQPLNCWLTIPEEYTWYHHYKATDDFIVFTGVVEREKVVVDAKKKGFAIAKNVTELSKILNDKTK